VKGVIHELVYLLGSIRSLSYN